MKTMAAVFKDEVKTKCMQYETITTSKYSNPVVYKNRR